MAICRLKADHNSHPRQANAMLLCSKKMPDTKKRAPTNALRTKMVHRWPLCAAKEE
jgi:hypothetical protein